MGLEIANFINELDSNNPDGADQRSQGDNHIRLVKSAMKNTFPGMAGRAFRVQLKSGNYTAVLNDNLSLISFSGAAVLNLSAAATLGNGWMITVQSQGGEVVIDPAGSELVNGQATFTVPLGQTVNLLADGGGFLALVFGVAAWSTGDVKPTFKNVADSGWVMMNDGSIGSAASGATTRAAADCEKLFQLLWNNIIDAWAPVSGGRGGSAATDWALNKRITLPRTLGRALAGAGAGAGLTARLLGEQAGAETHTLTQAQLPAVGLSIPSLPVIVTLPGGVILRYSTGGAAGAFGLNLNATGSNAESANTGTLSGSTNAGATGNMGSGQPHSIVSPEVFLNVMIKL